MHRGLPYPYHPTLWGTEAWFWPGLIPWKLHAEVYGGLVMPWIGIPVDWAGVSDVGYPLDAANKAMQWEFVVVPGGTPTMLWVALDKFTMDGVPSARWRMTVGTPGHPWAMALVRQEYPQRVVFAETWTYSFPSPPYTASTPPAIRLRPATYAEGGSPWP